MTDEHEILKLALALAAMTARAEAAEKDRDHFKAALERRGEVIYGRDDEFNQEAVRERAEEVRKLTTYGY